MGLPLSLQLLAYLAIFHCSFGDTNEANKPHILFILADDLGWNDVGYHGSEIMTPNIDALANSGVKLESYYVQPMCSPSRASLMTGRYPIHTALQHEVIYSGQRTGLPLEMKTLANELQDRGYATHGIGKWHLGFYKKEYLPRQRGFDSWRGYLGGNQGYYNHVNCEQLGCGYDFYTDNSIDFSANGTYSTFDYTARARQVIREHNSSQPLFMYLPYQAVHFPLQVPKRYLKKYSYIYDRNRRTYAAMATCMDYSIGRITGYLKAKGMWDNTIVIFSTDNGGETAKGGNNWPLRGKKWTLWEGGIRGVGFVHSPRLNMTQGYSHKSLMHITDWYPTIIEGILNDSLNENLTLDGVNMWNSIRENVPGPRTEILHNIDPLMPHPGDALYNDTFPTNTTAAIRVGDWKLLTGYPGVSEWFPPFARFLNQHKNWWGMIMAKWGEARLKTDLKQPFSNYDSKYHKADVYAHGLSDWYGRDKWTNEAELNLEKSISGEIKNVWLFNITADPEEIIDLSSQYPEVVLELLAKLMQYNSTAVEPNFPDLDPLAAPSRHNYTWGPWVDTDSQVSVIDQLLQTLTDAVRSTFVSALW